MLFCLLLHSSCHFPTLYTVTFFYDNQPMSSVMNLLMDALIHYFLLFEIMKWIIVHQCFCRFLIVLLGACFTFVFIGGLLFYKYRYVFYISENHFDARHLWQVQVTRNNQFVTFMELRYLLSYIPNISNIFIFLFPSVRICHLAIITRYWCD